MNTAKIVKADSMKPKVTELDPYYWAISRLQFDIFITLHFRDKNLIGIDPEAVTKRRRFFKNLLVNTRRHLAIAGHNIPQRGLKYFGVAEIGSTDRVHTHTMVMIRKEFQHLREQILDSIKKALPKEKVQSPLVEFVRDSQKAAAYICKKPNFLREGRYLAEEYYSTDFIDFVTSHLEAENSTLNTRHGLEPVKPIQSISRGLWSDFGVFTKSLPSIWVALLRKFRVLCRKIVPKLPRSASHIFYQNVIRDG